MTRCSWCLSPEHLLEQCSKVAAFKVATEHGIIDPMAAEEVNDAVALRMIAWRTAYFALLGWVKTTGQVPPDAILALNPDSAFENA